MQNPRKKSRVHVRYCTTTGCDRCGVPHEFPNTGPLTCPECKQKTTYLKHDDDTPTVEYVARNNSRLLLPASSKESKEADDDRPLLFGSSSDADIHVSCGDVEGCPIAPEHGPRVFVPFSLYYKWVWLAHKFSTEWVAFLTGKYDEKENEYHLDADGMFFPLQQVTSTNVWAETIEERPNTIASVHSHVDMKAFFSGTDSDHFNHPVEMVVNRAGAIDCVTRIPLKCGNFQRVSSAVTLVGTNELNSIVRDLKSKITAVSKPEPASNEVVATHYADKSPKSQGNGKTNLIVLTGDRLCKHGVKFIDPCPDCDKELAPYTTAQKGGNIYRTDLPPQAQTTSTSKDDDNPSDKAVGMALRIIDRRITHNNTHGIESDPALDFISAE